MVFVNIDSQERTSSRQLVFLMLVLGILLTVVVYVAPPTVDTSSSQISIEEVELVHVMLDEIQAESPELIKKIEAFRISFSENPNVLPVDFFKSDLEKQRETLLKTVAIQATLQSDEIAVVGE